MAKYNIEHTHTTMVGGEKGHSDWDVNMVKVLGFALGTMSETGNSGCLGFQALVPDYQMGGYKVGVSPKAHLPIKRAKQEAVKLGDKSRCLIIASSEHRKSLVTIN